MGIDFTESINFEKSLIDLRNEMLDFLKKYFLQEAYKIVALTRQRTPVDTGALRSNWILGNENTRIFTDENGKLQSDYKSAFAGIATIDSIKVVGDNLEISIVNNMFYATFVEYGTRFMNGRYMFTKSLFEVQNAMPQKFQKEFAKFIKERKF